MQESEKRSDLAAKMPSRRAAAPMLERFGDVLENIRGGEAPQNSFAIPLSKPVEECSRIDTVLASGAGCEPSNALQIPVVRCEGRLVWARFSAFDRLGN